MNINRLIWLFIPVGLLLGATLGLYLGWNHFAGAPVGAAPGDLKRERKEEYIRMVASAYAEEKDLRLARQRLERLNAGNAPLWVAELARSEAGEGRPESAARLARLAVALAIVEPEIVALAATPTPSPTAVPPEKITWEVIENKQLSCAEYSSGTAPVLVVRAIDELGAAVEGVSLQVAHPDGSPVTLRTNKDGETSMPLQGSWSLTLADGSTLTFREEGLVGNCASADGDSPHAYRVTFQRRVLP